MDGALNPGGQRGFTRVRVDDALNPAGQRALFHQGAGGRCVESGREGAIIGGRLYSDAQ